jgi:hypothetical protein
VALLPFFLLFDAFNSSSSCNAPVEAALDQVSSSNMPGEAARDEDSESNDPGEAAQVQATSSPEALFHLLDKVLLLKHLRGLKAEKTINGMPF